MNDVLIHGFYLKSFKGISAEGVRLVPLKKMNFLVGPNNSGKSTVLQFLDKYLHGKQPVSPISAMLGNWVWAREYSQEDVPIGRQVGDIKFGFGTPAEIVKKDIGIDTKGLIDALAKDGCIWIRSGNGAQKVKLLDWDNTTAERFLLERDWERIWEQALSMRGGGKSDWISGVLGRIAAVAMPNIPNVKMIPAIRQISVGDSLADFSGTGLINEIAKLQNPDDYTTYQVSREKLEAIQRFVRIITGVKNATIEVPFKRDRLLVHMEGKTLPLAALGTGIHEIIMLAAFCTLAENQIVCLEEPEIHLHPLLQRKLICYLHTETSNQYFIATHSSVMLDAVPAAVFSVTQSDGFTRIRLTSTPNDKFEICRALGYQASDLLQCNAIIWVEGPSDRIYLLHWIKAIAIDLVEGIDFSIMFYGGRLLSHLSATDEDVNEFISLRRLNRNVAVIIDSDKKNRNVRINDTKRRIRDELSDGCVWVTAGREVENYIPASLAKVALEKVCGKRIKNLGNMSQYGHMLKYVDTNDKDQTADKIKVAQEIAGMDADLSILDLRKRITELVAFIRKASGNSSKI
ncbi:hypothetical protein AGMMS50256_22120 [Betaproteobacteria bacterium]|nr:hypothetical protein AGMMS50256_22120 [Betaproteobacteria bacterium]